MREFHLRTSTKNGITETRKILGKKNDTKICTKCNVEKPIHEFHVAQKTNVGDFFRVKGRCKECANKERNVTRNIIPEWPNPGICELKNCINPATVADHDHETSKFRGWLCKECNTGFGKLGDSFESAEDLYNYVRRHYKNDLE